jgi:RNA polymerase sigma factor (sigma-70 family)
MNNLSERALEDYQLVCRAVEENDQLAYADLMERYRDSIFHTMLKMVHNRDDAEDLTIEAFGKAFRKLASYTPTYAFSTWLFKIATNNCIDFIRKKRMKTLSIDEPMGDDESKDYSNNLKAKSLDPEERFIREQRSKILRELLERLSDKYRRMIELRYFDELSYQEIADKLDLPIGTVKAQLFRAKELLMDILKNSKAKRVL